MIKSGHNIFEPILEKKSTIALGATPIGSAGRAPDDVFSWILQRWRREKFQELSLLPSGASFITQGWITQIFGTFKQSNKAATCDSRVASSRQNLNVVVKTYHEGKTPGSVLCGPVYAYGCALLVRIHVYDAKKNPSGRTGYPENHWDSFFVSPKCGKRMGLTGFPNSSLRGLNLK
jgi:hypothetical protein